MIPSSRTRSLVARCYTRWSSSPLSTGYLGCPSSKRCPTPNTNEFDTAFGYGGPVAVTASDVGSIASYKAGDSSKDLADPLYRIKIINDQHPKDENPEMYDPSIGACMLSAGSGCQECKPPRAEIGPNLRSPPTPRAPPSTRPPACSTAAHRPWETWSTRTGAVTPAAFAPHSSSGRSASKAHGGKTASTRHTGRDTRVRSARAALPRGVRPPRSHAQLRPPRNATARVGVGKRAFAKFVVL
jgi:hypothetical protein